jgi:hypothetical protein
MNSLHKHTTRFVLIIIFGVMELTGLSQQPIYIRHDFLSKQTVFYQLSGLDTVWISELKVKKQQPFIIDVYNVNTFHYNSSISLEKRTEDPANTKNIFAPFNLLTKTYGGAFANFLPILETIKSTRGSATSEQQLKAMELYESFDEVYDRIRKDDAYYQQLATHEIYLLALKQNLTKTEQEIKQDADAYISTQIPAFLTLQKQKKIPDSKADMYMKLRIDSAKKIMEELTEIRKKAKEDFEVNGQSFDASFQKTAYYFDQVMKLAANDYKNGNEFSKKLQIVYSLYDELMNARFHYNFKAECSHETAGIKLAVFPINKTTSADTIYRYFKVNKPTYGFRLRNSVGIAFSFFEEGNRNYFIKLDSTIGYSRGDGFTPLIASYLHFYFANPSTVKVGGTLGVGIPLSREQSVNFLAGVSLILGKNDNFNFTAGIAGTKINKLDLGLKAGDKVPAREYALPFKSFYDLGGFASFSFNLNVLSKK